MVKPELGTKRLCPTCGGKFYDLHKKPAECPYCEAVFNPDDLTRGKRSASPRPAPEEVKPVEKKPPKKEATEDEDENLDDIEVNDVETDSDDDEDDDILEDASDLGEDEEDVAEVMDNVERPDGGD